MSNVRRLRVKLFFIGDAVNGRSTVSERVLDGCELGEEPPREAISERQLVYRPHNAFCLNLWW